MINNFWYKCEITIFCENLPILLDQLVRLRLERRVYIEKYELTTKAGLYIVYDDLDGGEKILFDVLRELKCKVEGYSKRGVGNLSKVLDCGKGLL